MPLLYNPLLEFIVRTSGEFCFAAGSPAAFAVTRNECLGKTTLRLTFGAC
jgi:hypothetical protein